MPLPTLLISRPASRGLVAAVVVGVVLALSASQIAGLLARLLPWRSEVKSAGTFFPAFPESAPIIIERIGWTLIVAPVLAIAVSALRGLRLVSGRVVGRIAANSPCSGDRALDRVARDAPQRLPVQLAHPLGRLSDRADRALLLRSKTYPTSPLLRDTTCLAGLNAAILVALCVLVARQLGFSLPASVLLSSIVATSGNLLLFANTAEDVFINLTLVFIVIAASLHGRAIWLGLALAALLLGPTPIHHYLCCRSNRRVAGRCSESLVARKGASYPHGDDARRRNCRHLRGTNRVLDPRRPIFFCERPGRRRWCCRAVRRPTDRRIHHSCVQRNVRNPPALGDARGDSPPCSDSHCACHAP